MVGGTTLGYCATASRMSATAPITTMRMASTFAKTGRSMKNFEIMAPLIRAGRLGGRGLRRLQLRIDLLPRYGVEDAGHDHPLVRLEPAVDHAHLARRLAELHPALLDDAVGVDNEHVAARLIGADRDFRHEQRLLRPQRHPHANEIARQQSGRRIL